MAFDRKAWARVYMRAYRRGKRRRPRPGYFDKKAWSRPYMREYMRKVRARQKLERERDEAINAAMTASGQNEPCHSLRRHGGVTSVSGPPRPTVGASQSGQKPSHRNASVSPPPLQT